MSSTVCTVAQLCVHLLCASEAVCTFAQYSYTTAVCTLFTQYREDVCTMAQYSCVYDCPGVLASTRPLCSLKIDESIAGTSPRYRFMVTLEPGTRQMQLFDTKLQMFESLNFVQKITNSPIETPDPFPGVCRDYKRG